MCSTPCMSPVTYALHQDQNEGEREGSSTALGCPECRRSYPSPLKFYTGDKCGDNAIPKNVKMFVNSTITSAGGTFFLVGSRIFCPGSLISWARSRFSIILFCFEFLLRHFVAS
jgi:hypothetical protein